MTLVKRFTRLITADMHSVLDSVEEPIALIKQHVREMEEAIRSEKNHISQVKSLIEQTQKDLVKNHQSTQKLAEDLNLCLENSDDELARKVIKQKLLTERQASRLSQNLEDLKKSETTSSRLLDEFQSKYEEINEELEELVRAEAVSREAKHQSSLSSASLDKVGKDDVEVALLQAKKQFAHPGE